MGTTTEKEIIDALASALEGMMQVLRHGRFGELNRKEIKAYNRAADAMNLLERSPFGPGNSPE